MISQKETVVMKQIYNIHVCRNIYLELLQFIGNSRQLEILCALSIDSNESKRRKYL